MKELIKLFEGRLSRKEWWISILLVSILSFAFVMVGEIIGIGDLTFLLAIPILLVFSISIHVRRLHDIDASGWYVLVLFIPIIGFFLGLFVSFSKGDEGPNKYGNPPENNRPLKKFLFNKEQWTTLEQKREILNAMELGEAFERYLEINRETQIQSKIGEYERVYK